MVYIRNRTVRKANKKKTLFKSSKEGEQSSGRSGRKRHSRSVSLIASENLKNLEASPPPSSEQPAPKATATTETPEEEIQQLIVDDLQLPDFIQIFFSASVFNYLDPFGTKDPCLALFLRDYHKGSFYEIGRTNVCKDTSRPVFYKSILIDPKQVRKEFLDALTEEVKKQIRKKVVEQQLLKAAAEADNHEAAAATLVKKKSSNDDDDGNLFSVSDRKLMAYVAAHEEEVVQITQKVALSLPFELRLFIFDADKATNNQEIESGELIGCFDFSVDELVESKFVLERKKLKIGHKIFGSVSLYAEPLTSKTSLSSPKNKLRLLVFGFDIPQVDLLSQSDPYFVIYREVGNGEVKQLFPVYISEAKSNSLDPCWQEVVIPEVHLCKGDRDMKLKFVIFDYNMLSKNVEIGEVELSVNEAMKNPEAEWAVSKTGFLSKISRKEPKMRIYIEEVAQQKTMRKGKAPNRKLTPIFESLH